MDFPTKTKNIEKWLTKDYSNPKGPPQLGCS